MIHITFTNGHQLSLIRIAHLHRIQKLSSDKTITQILFQKI